MMAELMRPPTEEEAAMMMSMMGEVMKPPTEEEMAEMEQGNNVQTCTKHHLPLTTKSPVSCVKSNFLKWLIALNFPAWTDMMSSMMSEEEMAQMEQGGRYNQKT